VYGGRFLTEKNEDLSVKYCGNEITILGKLSQKITQIFFQDRSSVLKIGCQCNDDCKNFLLSLQATRQ
jgi:hypothetical protein